MHKKGSELNDILNPLIDRFLKTEAYYELCEKFEMVHGAGCMARSCVGAQG